MIARVIAKTIRFGEPRRSLPCDFLALQHGGEIQEAKPWHKLNVTLRVMWIAYLTSQHLEATAGQGLCSCCRAELVHQRRALLQVVVCNKQPHRAHSPAR